MTWYDDLDSMGARANLPKHLLIDGNNSEDHGITP
jgi:hypothetical protein